METQGLKDMRAALLDGGGGGRARGTPWGVRKKHPAGKGWVAPPRENDLGRLVTLC